MPTRLKRVKKDKVKKSVNFITFDIETLPDKNYKNALYGDTCYISYCDKNGAYGIASNDLTQFFIDRILIPENDKSIIYAHNGFGFDYKRLDIRRLAEYGYTGKIVRDKNNNYKAIDLELGGDKWRLQDSLVKFPFTTLKKLLATFAPEYSKLTLDFEHENFDSNNIDHVRYAIRDAEGLYKAIEKIDSLFQHHFNISFHASCTAPGLSFKAFETFCKENETDIPQPSQEHIEIFRESYFGGQTLAFDCNWHDEVMALDIHSSYGAAMLNNPMPSGMSRTVSFRKSPTDLVPESLYYAEVFCPPEIKPILKSAIKKKDKIMRGNFAGHFSGWWYGLELNLAKKYGMFIEVQKKVEFSESTSILQRFIEKILPLREVKKSAEDTLGKLLQNSLYGKFASESMDEDLIITTNPPEGAKSVIDWSAEEIDGEIDDTLDYLWEVENARNSKEKPIHWGAYITALARHKLNSAILLKPDAVLYCDTDSIFIESQYLPFFESLIGEEYGEWGIESDKRGRFRAFGAKAYQIGTEKKNKGIPRREFERVVRSLKAENPDITQTEISNKLAALSSMIYNQFNGINKVVKGGDYGKPTKRKCASPQKITIGAFDADGVWRPEFIPKRTPEDETGEAGAKAESSAL